VYGKRDETREMKMQEKIFINILWSKTSKLFAVKAIKVGSPSKLLKLVRRQSRYGAKEDTMRQERCNVKECLIGASMRVTCRESVGRRR
jgi:hypothetical protein